MGFIKDIFSPPKPKMPDFSAAERRREEAEKQMEAERQRFRQAMAGRGQQTILTSGMGVEEEAETSQTMLGSA